MIFTSCVYYMRYPSESRSAFMVPLLLCLNIKVITHTLKNTTLSISVMLLYYKLFNLYKCETTTMRYNNKWSPCPRGLCAITLRKPKVKIVVVVFANVYNVWYVFGWGECTTVVPMPVVSTSCEYTRWGLGDWKRSGWCIKLIIRKSVLQVTFFIPW